MALALVFRISFQRRTRPYMEFGFDLPRIEQGEIGFIFIRRIRRILTSYSFLSVVREPTRACVNGPEESEPFPQSLNSRTIS